MFNSTGFNPLVEPNNSEEHHKILLLGCNNVGKTSLVRRFVCDSFHEEYNPTLGADIVQTSFMTTEKVMKIYFWDTSGESTYTSIVKTYIKHSKGILIVYESNEESIKKAKWWLDQIDSCSSTNIPIWLIKNKIDIEKFVVLQFFLIDNKKFTYICSNENKQIFSLENEIMRCDTSLLQNKLFEVSAKTGQGIKHLFNDIIKQLNGSTSQTEHKLYDISYDPVPPKSNCLSCWCWNQYH
ncbi:GTP-binding protein ryh1-like [Entamoeba marina]